MAGRAPARAGETRGSEREGDRPDRRTWGTSNEQRPCQPIELNSVTASAARADHAHDVIDLIHDRPGDGLGPVGAPAKDAVDLGGVLHQAVHLGRDRLQLGHGKVGQRGLEGAELRAREIGHHLRGRVPGKGRVDVHEVARLGPVLQPVERVGQRLGVGLGLADLLGDRVGAVGQVDAALVGGVGFRHLLGAVAQAHDPRGSAFDHRLDHREEVHAVVVVELDRDVAGQFQVLLLVLAHRHMRGLVGQDVGGHQRRIGEQAQRAVLGVLAGGLVLELGHAAHPAHARDAVEDPGKFDMRGHLALVEQDRARRVDAGGDEACRRLARLLAQLRRVLPDGDRVHVDEAVDRLDPLVLLFDEALERAEIVAQRQPARGLDAREDARRKGLRRLDRLES